MKFKEIVINETEFLLRIGNLEPIKFQKLPPNKFNIDDIQICVFDKSQVHKSFADYSLESVINIKPIFNPLVTIVFNENPYPFCAIIGLWEIVFVDFQQKTSQTILQLFRKESDDGGFYFLKILTLTNAFIVIYESGITRITNKGHVEWHKSLYWDDIYCKTDDYYIYYSSEHRNNEDWRINIIDGEIIEGWS